MVMGPIGDLISKWVSSRLPLVDLIARTMTVMYVTLACPVFSSKDFGHMTVILSNGPYLGGQLIACPGCPTTELSFRGQKTGSGQRSRDYHCKQCNNIVNIKHKDFVAAEERDKRVQEIKATGKSLKWVPYPIVIATLPWRQKRPPGPTKKQPPNPAPPMQRETSKRTRRDSSPTAAGQSLQSIQRKRSKAGEFVYT